MKKLIAVIIIVILAFSGFLAYRDYMNPEISPEAEAESFDYESYFNSLEVVDYDKITNLYKPDDVIGTIGGEDITWKQYSYYFKYFTSGAESTIAYAPMYYGGELSWDDLYDEELTFAEAPTALTEEQLAVHAAINQMAKKNHVEMDQKLYDDYLNKNIQSAGAANADEFFATIAKNGVDKEDYEFVVGDTVLGQSICEALYGSVDSEENVNKMNEELGKIAKELKFIFADGFKAPYVKDFFE